MLAGMGLVLGTLTAGALASAAPHPPGDTLNCGGGAVQVIQADGVLTPAPAGNPATPAEATSAAHQTAQDFLHSVLPGVRVDAMVDAPADAAGTTLPPPAGDTGRLEVPGATVASKAGGQVTAVVSLERDASGRRWAVDRATVCAGTTVATFPGDHS